MRPGDEGEAQRVGIELVGVLVGASMEGDDVPLEPDERAAGGAGGPPATGNRSGGQSTRILPSALMYSGTGSAGVLLWQARGAPARCPRRGSNVRGFFIRIAYSTPPNPAAEDPGRPLGSGLRSWITSPSPLVFWSGSTMSTCDSLVICRVASSKSRYVIGPIFRSSAGSAGVPRSSTNRTSPSMWACSISRPPVFGFLPTSRSAG